MEKTNSGKKAEILAEILTKFPATPTDPMELLPIISDEIAEKKTVPDHHQSLCGITWPPLVCAPESDDVVQSTETESPTPPASSDVVDALLPVLKEGQQNVFGREHEERQLLTRLMSKGSQLAVIPIVGMGGIGKTALARLVYDNKDVQKHFEVKAWVGAAGEDFKHLQDVARKLIKAATGMSCPLDSLGELDEMVRDYFLSQRSLIVLDEIESIDEASWLHMRKSWFSVVGLGSKVIITSRNKNVADALASVPYELKELSQYASLSLYSSFFIEDTVSSTATSLAARCEGVPLSLKLLGSLMRFEEGLTKILSSGDFMERIPSSLHFWVVLALSVLALPQDLLNCFSYCSLFPCGDVLEKDKLTKMWVAEGFITPCMGMQITPEETAGAYFHQLVCRCYFTDVTCDEYGDIVQVRMPAMIHQFAQMIAAATHRDKVAYVVAGVDQEHDSDSFSLASPFGEKCDKRHLKTLISPSVRDSSMKVNRSNMKFKRLITLDLSNTGVQKLSHHISGMKRLKYLSLSHTLIIRLPKWITRLVRLQTLDLSRCYYLKELPEKITNLSGLRHLDLSECNSLLQLPSGISSLIHLKSMPLFVLGPPNRNFAGLEELHELNELKGVLFIRNLENVKNAGQAQSADLKNKKIRHLGLSWSSNVDECLEVLECLQPNPEIKVLDLSGYGGYGFPSWMPKLNELVKLSLKDCRFHRLPTLGKLPSLKELLLEGLMNVRSIGPEFYGTAQDGIFPRLGKLKLSVMHKLYNWSSAATSGAFPVLHTLAIQNCPQLQSLPSLPSVTELVVWSSNSKILPLLIRLTSLSSLVINDMVVGESLGGLSLVKNLVVLNCTNLKPLISHHMKRFTTLTHLSIISCLGIEAVELSRLQSLQKLNIVDCQDLRKIELVMGNNTLEELVIEDCSQLESIGATRSFDASLRKLIVRNCRQFSILPRKNKKLQALEFLFINGCPQLETWLDDEKSQISHTSCVILGNRRSSRTL